MKSVYAVFVIFSSLFVMGLTHAKEYPEFSLGGKLMLDYDHFDSEFLENPAMPYHTDAFEIRRFRLSIKSTLNKNWRAELSLDASDGSEIKDAFIKYNGWKNTDITIGRQREPFGLERLMGSKNLSLIERSIVSNAIAPGRAYGVLTSGDKHNVNWQFGYFQAFNTQRSDAWTGRVAWEIWDNDSSTLHVGTSLSKRNLDADEFRINERLEVNTADSLIEGTRIDAKKALLKGVEMMWQFGGFSTIAEWQHATVRSTESAEFEYEGGYVQLSYLFSGLNRKYKNGILKGTNSNSDWETTLRYSTFSLDRENNDAQIISAGINYYLNKNWKFMANVINTQYGETAADNVSGNAISFRAQYVF